MPVIIFDIDGVFIPFYARHNPNTEFIFVGSEKTGEFLHPTMQLPWLQQLSSQAKLVWGSAREHPNAVLTLLKHPGEWEQIPLSREDVGLGTWKIKSVKKWVEEHVPAEEKLVWVDDELEEDVLRWFEARGNALAVIPTRDEGLTQEGFNRIQEFLKEGN